jgi:hypothetical protein
MATFYGAVDLSKNELRQAQVQNLSSAPASPVLGQIYFNTADATLYCCTNTTGPIWTAAKAGAGATPASTVTTQAIGDGGTVGTGANFAREDHKHGMPAFGSVTAETTYGLASANGSASSLSRSDHTHGTPAHDASAHSTIPLSALAVPSVDVSFNSKKITNLAEPNVPSDAATKNYVDATVFGLAWKDAVRVATTANTALSGFLTIDGVTTVVQDRVLVKNQSTASQNGIWVVQSGAWYRATDVDSANEIAGMCVFVQEGSTQADTAWVLTTNLPITIDTTNLTYAQFGTGGATYVGGAGLTLSANTFDVGAGTGITVAADSVAVDTAVIPTITSMNAAIAAAAGARKFAAGLSGTASPETVTHNLNTRDISLTVLNGASPYTAVEVDWDATTVNTAVLRYSPNLGAGYRVVVVG